MSELLLKWLNDEVGLSKEIRTFESDFANGYLFGELLHRHGLVTDFTETYVDESTRKAKSANFARLKSALQKGSASSLGIKLNDESVSHMMDEDRGASLRLLYQLRKELLQASQGGHDRPASHTKAATARLVRPQKGEHEERFFDGQLRSLKRTDPRTKYEFHTKPFVDEHTSQMQRAESSERKEKATIKSKQTDFRDARLASRQKNRQREAEVTKFGDECWRANMQRKFSALEKDLAFEKTTIKREQAKIDRVREAHRQDCGYGENNDSHGIGWFEKNLQRIGIDTSEHAGSTGTPIEAASGKELHDKMREKLPSQAQLRIECAGRMGKIKDTKKAGDQAQKERERRRRRVLVEQQATELAVDEQRREEDLLEWLQQQTVEYRREAAAYDLAQRRKDAMWFQRKKKQQGRTEKQATEREQAYARIAEKAMEDRLAKQERALVRQAAGLEQPQHQARALEEEPSSDDDELELPPARSPARSAGTRGGSPPPHGRPSAQPSPEPSLFGGGVEADAVAPAQALVQRVEDPRVSEYLFWRGEWGQRRPAEADVRASLSEDRPAPWRPRFGDLVRWLCSSGRKPQEVCETELPASLLPVIAVSGNPCGLGNPGVGNTIAQRICTEYGFVLLEVQAVVEECLALAQKEEEEPEWPMLARLRELGRAFLEHQEGAGGDPEVAVPYSLFAEMVFRKIELIAAPPPPKPEEEEEPPPDPKKKKPPPKGKKVEEEPKEVVKPKGVVIVGYLMELGQLATWEASLRGYLSPLLRVFDGEEDLQARLSAVVAPWRCLEAAPEGSTMDAEDLRFPKVAARPPAQLLRLRHPDHNALCDAVVGASVIPGVWERGAVHPPASEAAPQASPASREGSRRGGRASPTQRRPSKGNCVEPPSVEKVKPGPRCEGYDQEHIGFANPVDRAWLYEERQGLVETFAGPLASCADVFLPPRGRGGDAEDGVASPEEELWRQVQELVEGWLRLEDQVQPPTEEAAAQEAKEDAGGDAEGGSFTGEDAPEAGEGSEGAAVVEETVLVATGDPWLALDADAQERMRSAWLKCLSGYLTRLQTALTELHEEASGYGQNLVRTQRGFLELLQRTDERGQVVTEFLRGWPERTAGRSSDSIVDEVEELSDRLWQLADRRRAEAVEEHQRITSSGFWEEHAQAGLRIAAQLQDVETDRFRDAVALLGEAYGMPEASLSEPDDLGELTDGCSSVSELASWLHCRTNSLARASLVLPKARSYGGDWDQEEGEEVDKKEEEEEGGEGEVAIEESLIDDGEGWRREELRDAVLAEQLGHVQRLRVVETWTVARLRVMKQQLDDSLRRMDDWIRDRVRAENDAIKAAAAQLLGGWDNEELTSPTISLKTPKSSRGAGRPAKVAPSPTGGPARRRQREVLKALEARTLDANVLHPPQLEVDSGLNLAVAAPGAEQPPDCWSKDMLSDLWQRFLARGGSGGSMSQDAVLDVVRDFRFSGFRFDLDAAPPAWVKRSEATLGALCSALVSPAWGTIAVDITELIVMLTFHQRQLSWPTMEALMASREMLESSIFGLSHDQLVDYPDVPVTIEAFMRLPLWDTRPASVGASFSERPELIKEWLFQVLLAFEDEAKPRRMNTPERGTVSARRLFTYLGLGVTPMDGLQRALKLLLCPRGGGPQEEEGAEAPREIRVQELWAILFSQQARPPGVVAPAPALADFCAEVLQRRRDAEGGDAPIELDPEAPSIPPEVATMVFEEQAVCRHPAVVRGLCTHGAPLCRRRALSDLFPLAGAAPGLHTVAEALEARGLTTLVPPTPEERTPTSAAGSSAAT